MELLNKGERKKSILKFLGIWLVGLLSIAWVVITYVKQKLDNDKVLLSWTTSAKNQLDLIDRLGIILTHNATLLEQAVNDSLIEETNNIPDSINLFSTEFYNLINEDRLYENNSLLINILGSLPLDSLLAKIRRLKETPKYIYVEGNSKSIPADRYKTLYFNLKKDFNELLNQQIDAMERMANQAKVARVPSENDIYKTISVIKTDLQKKFKK